MKFSKVCSLTLALFAAAALSAGNIKYEKSADKVVVDQGDFRCEIVSTGGQISSWQMRDPQRELVADPGLKIGGISKVKDGLFNDISPQINEYDLKVEATSKDELTVIASWKAAKGVLKGIRMERRFIFRKGVAAIAVRETLQAVDKGGDVFLQIHNSIAVDEIKGAKTVFSSSTADSAMRFTYNDLNRETTQAFVEPKAAWIGFVNSDKKRGFALLFEKSSLIRNVFAWSRDRMFTLSANLNNVNIAPIAERDVWHTTYYMLPLQGEGELLSVTEDIAVSGKALKGKTQLNIWLPEAPGAGEVYAAVNGKTIKSAPVKANSRYYSLVIPATAGKVTVGFKSGKVAADTVIDGNFAKVKALKAVRRLPKVNFSYGPQGLYYYYPDIYVAQNNPAWIGLAVRGNYKDRKNTRYALILPEEVEVMHFTGTKTDVVIDGRKMIRYEIPGRNVTTKSQVTSFCLQLKKALPEKAFAGVQLRWQGGEQKMLKYNLKEVGNFPKLDKELKHFSVGIQARRDPATQPLEQYGFNRLMYIRQERDFYYGFKGEGYHKDILNKLYDRKIEPIMAYLAFYRLSRLNKARNNRGLLKESGTLDLPKRNYKPIETDRLWAVDINGKKINLLCPYTSSRTRYMEKALDQHRIAMEYGWNHFALDEEHWSNGATLCLCKECQAEFARRVKAANLPAVDLLSVSKNPIQYPKHSDLWWDMKTDHVADIYKRMRENLDTYKPNGTPRKLLVWVDRRVALDGSRYNAITNRLSDYRKLAVYADELLPMCYEASSAFVGLCAYQTSTLIKGLRAKLIMGIAPHRAYEFNRVVTQNFGSLEALEEQIVECLFNGAKGVMIWAGERCLRGAMDMLNTANAVKRILPIEEIMFFGKPVKIACDNPAVTVTALEYKGKIAVFMRNYSSKTMEAELTLPKNIKSVTDTFTGKKLNKAKVKFVGGSRIHTLLLQ